MNNKWFNTAQYQKIIRFFGATVLKLFIFSLFAGFAVYAVEVAFAYGLQAFLKALGVMTAVVTRLPWWVPEFPLSRVLIFFFLIGTARCVLQWLQIYLQGITAEELRFLLRKRLLRWAFHSESVSSSQVMILMNERMAAVSAVVNSLQILIVQLTCGILLGLSLMFMAPKLTFIVVIILIFLLLPMKSFDTKIGVSGRGMAAEGDKISRQLLSSIKNLLLMHIYGTQVEEEAKAQARSEAIRYHHFVYYMNGALKFALPQFVGLVLICLIAVISKEQIGMQPGKLISYFYLFMRFLQTISAAAQATAPVVQHWSQLADFAKWWADHSYDGWRNQKKLDANLQNITPLSSPIGWRLKGISFAYPGSQEPVFTNLDLSIKSGECVVITGPSGVGKSTLIQLLLGGVKLQQGSIELVDGSGRFYDLESMKSNLLRSIGYVGAESFLIEGTIHENLIYGLRHQPSKEEIIDACNKAECQFIFTMTTGLDHFLSEQGQGLSAGQKQRLSLARALLRQPKILILDEATANLDVDTEQKLIDTLSGLKGQMTIIAVTHRRALLKIADQEIKLGKW